jgi:hypothetical protein
MLHFRATPAVFLASDGPRQARSRLSFLPAGRSDSARKYKPSTTMDKAPNEYLVTLVEAADLDSTVEE